MPDRSIVASQCRNGLASKRLKVGPAREPELKPPSRWPKPHNRQRALYSCHPASVRGWCRRGRKKVPPSAPSVSPNHRSCRTAGQVTSNARAAASATESEVKVRRTTQSVRPSPVHRCMSQPSLSAPQEDRPILPFESRLATRKLRRLWLKAGVRAAGRGCGTGLAHFFTKGSSVGAMGPWLVTALDGYFPIGHKRDVSMSAVGFTHCLECGKKLHTTFFCQECGQPSCSLDCYCRHEANHAGRKQAAQLEHQAGNSPAHLEPAR